MCDTSNALVRSLVTCHMTEVILTPLPPAMPVLIFRPERMKGWVDLGLNHTKMVKTVFSRPYLVWSRLCCSVASVCRVAVCMECIVAKRAKVTIDSL